MDLMFGSRQHLLVTSSPCSNGIFSYLQDKKYFPFKTVIIDDSLQITLVEKNKCQVSFGICSILLFVQLFFITS